MELEEQWSAIILIILLILFISIVGAIFYYCIKILLNRHRGWEIPAGQTPPPPAKPIRPPPYGIHAETTAAGQAGAQTQSGSGQAGSVTFDSGPSGMCASYVSGGSTVGDGQGPSEQPAGPPRPYMPPRSAPATLLMKAPKQSSSWQPSAIPRETSTSTVPFVAPSGGKIGTLGGSMSTLGGSMGTLGGSMGTLGPLSVQVEFPPAQATSQQSTPSYSCSPTPPTPEDSPPNRMPPPPPSE